jgi:ferrous iron transport protein A
MMMALDSVGLRKQVRVIAIDGGHGVRAHLNTLGIHIGDWLTVVERAPFRGPVLVEKLRVDSDGTIENLLEPSPSPEAKPL